MSRPLSVQIGKPAEVNISSIRNDTFIFPFNAYDVNGDPYDFSGHSFLMDVKKHISSNEDFLTISNSSFNITQDAIGQAAGVNNLIIISHEDKYFDRSFIDYIYDIEMTLPSGVVQTIVKGYISILKDVSQIDE